MRKLASIQIINNISPIEGSDFIEQVQILGWNLVTKKGEFNINDKCIYIEIDSIVKECSEFEFLRKYKFRVKTQKIRGVISQGLAIPLQTFNISKELEIGTDVTELLGITKYLTPSEREEFEQEERKVHNEKNKLKKYMMRYSWFRKLVLPKTKKTGFPDWVSKTDEERIQNVPQLLSYFKNYRVYVTEKIDYQSVTFTGKMFRKYPKLGKLSPKKFVFVVCSRTITNNDKNSLYWKIARKYNIEKILKENPTLTIQGEQGDTKVQGNKYGIKEPTLWVFNIIDHERKYHYDYDEMRAFCEIYDLGVVYRIPIKVDGEMIINPLLSELGTTVSEIIERAKGKSLIADIPREGIVVRCIDNGQKILSFKAINPDFLLKYE